MALLRRISTELFPGGHISSPHPRTVCRAVFTMKKNCFFLISRVLCIIATIRSASHRVLSSLSELQGHGLGGPARVEERNPDKIPVHTLWTGYHPRQVLGMPEEGMEEALGYRGKKREQAGGAVSVRALQENHRHTA